MRFWFPGVVLAVSALGLTTLWAWPSEELEPATRVLVTQSAIALTVFILVLWGVIFTPYRREILTGTALVVVALAVSIGRVGCTGDMLLQVAWRWQKSGADRLEAHRAAQVNGERPAAVAVTALQPTDFPEYRGRNRDGIVTGPRVKQDWKANPPTPVWRHPVGGGHAGFAVAGNAAVTIEQRRDDEAVVCYDTATGQERWVHAYPAHFTELMGGEGPRATPTIADDAVYSLGAAGTLVCLDLASGHARWSVNILDGNENVRWGKSGSPLVYDRVVVLNPGAQTEASKGKALVALDRRTGKIVWQAGNTQAGYSSPMLATLGGRRQILLLDGEVLAGYDADGGSELWHYPWPTQNGINVAQPLVLSGDRVFVSAAYGAGCAMLHITETAGEWQVKQLWGNKLLRCKFTSPVAHQGYIYGLDEGILACVDQQSGARKWRDGRYGHGQMLLVNGMLLILSETGKLVLVEATPQGCHELASMPALDGKTWNYPAVAGGRAYVRNAEEMACYDLTDPHETPVDQ
jgi:outer membrane protein assembly factor BamB